MIRWTKRWTSKNLKNIFFEATFFVAFLIHSITFASIKLLNMKKTIFLLLLFSATIFVGCKEKPKDLLTKKWKITDMTMPGQAMPDSVKNTISQGTMEFTKDGKMTLTGMGMGGDQSGTYTLSDDGKILTVMTNGKSESNDVTELSKSTLKITDKTSGSSLTAVPK